MICWLLQSFSLSDDVDNQVLHRQVLGIYIYKIVDKTPQWKCFEGTMTNQCSHLTLWELIYKVCQIECKVQLLSFSSDETAYR